MIFNDIVINLRIFYHDVCLRHKVEGLCFTTKYPWVRQMTRCFTCDLTLVDDTYEDPVREHY